MNTQEIISALEKIKEQILGWAQKESFQGKDDSSSKVLQETEDALRSILKKIDSLNQQEKEKIQPILNAMKNEILAHHEKMQEQLNEAKQALEKAKLHKKGINHYNQL